MSLTKSIQKNLSRPATAAGNGLSGWFDSAGASWSRSIVFTGAALGATVALGAALAYRNVRKAGQDEGAHSPVSRFTTVDGARDSRSREIASVSSAPNANAQSLHAFAAEAIEYSRQSFDNSNALSQKLMRARKLDDVLELQSEFVRRAYGNFIVSAFKMVELCSNMAREAFAPSLGASNAAPNVAADPTGKLISEADRQTEEITSRVHNAAKYR